MRRNKEMGSFKIFNQNFGSYTLILFHFTMSDAVVSEPPPPIDQTEEPSLPSPTEATEQNSEINNDNTPTEGENKKNKKKSTISDRLYEEKKKQDVYYSYFIFVRRG